MDIVDMAIQVGGAIEGQSFVSIGHFILHQNFFESKHILF
jgi:hypothetical protein